MSLDKTASATRQKVVETETLKATVRRVSTRQLLRLLSVVDRLKTDMGITAEELQSMDFNSKSVADLFRRLLEACLGKVNYNDPKSVNPNAAVLFSELASAWGITPDELLDADVDDLVLTMEAFWEVNSSGPLGLKILGTIAGLKPTLELSKDLMIASFHGMFIKALPAGGTSGGGTTGSSYLSTESSTGQSTTS